MKIVQINATCGVGSTGKICLGISKLLTAKNIENYICYSNKSNGHPLGIRCSDVKYIKIQALKSRILGNYGFNSQRATVKIIQELERIKPDIVHIHNIHGHDYDLEKLFGYFRRKKTKLVWTFHDCWAFTGYCTHFTAIKCDKWRTQCSDCMQKREYSWFFDKSGALFEKKKRLFQGLNLTIVTPSQWLADLVKQSFLQDYPVKVINNGIDLSVFKDNDNKIRHKTGLENKKIVLGVAFGWNERKGLDVFIELSNRLSDDYRIFLVGTSDEICRKLPNNILTLNRTQNQQELAEIYATADIFVNPTREDTYPTVNMEALACGTPVLTFQTGGSSEILDKTCGSVVACDDVESMEKEIIRICESKPYGKEACLNKAKEFDQNKRFKEYIELYERINIRGN